MDVQRGQDEGVQTRSHGRWIVYDKMVCVKLAKLPQAGALGVARGSRMVLTHSIKSLPFSMTKSWTSGRDNVFSVTFQLKFLRRLRRSGFSGGSGGFGADPSLADIVKLSPACNGLAREVAEARRGSGWLVVSFFML